MTVTRMTEKVKVKLVSGEEVDVLIYKYVTYREQQKIYQKLFKDVKIKSKAEDVDFSPSNLFEVINEMAEIVWAEKNYTLEEVSGDSLSEVIIDRFESFLGNLGFKVENGNSQVGVPGKDGEHIHSPDKCTPKST